MTNNEIAHHFELLGKLSDIHGENSFKSKSYSIAAFNIEKMTVQLSEMPKQKLSSLQGIGDAIGKKIIELEETGTLKTLEALLEKTPPGILEMLKIKGIGPKKISLIWKEMGIENIGELLYACHENRLMLYKGFGIKTQNNVIASIEFYQKQQGNYLYAQVELLSHELQKLLGKLFNSAQVSIAGASRRQVETLDQLEYIVPVSSTQIKTSLETLEEFQYLATDNNSILYRYDNGIKLKLYASTPALLLKDTFQKTGSSEFTEAFNREFPDADFSVNNEELLFQTLNLQYIPPALRESATIIKKAKASSIPRLIEPSDIRGVIHSHSDWSDGSNTLPELAEGCISKGLEYLVISDHSKAAFYAKGLTEERVSAQHEFVDELNKKYQSKSNGQPFKIFKSIESDILNDGSLDYSDSVLARFDLVIASVHSNLKMSEEKAMKRLLAAIENPYTIILGHMTGRLLLSRSGFPLNYKTIIDACATNHVVIELNAHPRRLDMRWQWLEYALGKNVLISINPDAHSIKEFDNTRYGVYAAQKGMLTMEQNLSSFSLPQFEKFLRDIKKIKGI